MKFLFIVLLLTSNFANAFITEEVFVQSPTDTDGNGELDLIYVSIERPSTDKKLASIYRITPYAFGGNQLDFHTTDVELLPQDESIKSKSKNLTKLNSQAFSGFARVNAHSVGTGNSLGCPTVGDINETLAAKAVIDWLNGRAKAFNKSGDEVSADWSNGKVGMIGVSYNGTLPTMVASTGVEGLKAIVPIAAISSWYDYYRANGLVVNPGGYVGEDADIIGRYIVRKDACENELQEITLNMGREHGDFHKFWQDRNYLPLVKNIKAATFVVHGQSDWNVKQKHAIQLWEALPKTTPKRMFLHSGPHIYPGDRTFRKNVEKWLNHYVKGEVNDLPNESPIRVQDTGSSRVSKQMSWPNEGTEKRTLKLGNGDLVKIIDGGKLKKVSQLLKSPDENNENRVIFLSDKLPEDILISGTARIKMNISVLNRRAANISVALIEYGRFNSGKIITRGWADPQNHKSIEEGELLIPSKKYLVEFDLEPKQYQVSSGNKIGLMITSTDFDFTFRPSVGTELEITTGKDTTLEIFTSAPVSDLK